MYTEWSTLLHTALLTRCVLPEIPADSWLDCTITFTGSQPVTLATLHTACCLSWPHFNTVTHWIWCFQHLSSSIWKHLKTQPQLTTLKTWMISCIIIQKNSKLLSVEHVSEHPSLTYINILRVTLQGVCKVRNHVVPRSSTLYAMLMPFFYLLRKNMNKKINIKG